MTDTTGNHLKVADFYKIQSQAGRELEWQRLGHNPTTWGLGTLEGDEMTTVVAKVTRRNDGWWDWTLIDGVAIGSGIYRLSGREPGRLLAMAGAEKLIKPDYYLEQRLSGRQ